MSRFIENAQLVLAQPPWDMSSAASASEWVCMKNWGHLEIIFMKHVGADGDDPTITVEQATADGGTGKALNFTTLFKKQGTVLTAIGDFTKVTQAAANTYTNTDLAQQQAIIVIEFDSSDLDVDNGYDWVKATIADVGANAQDGCILYRLSEPRYAAATPPSAIA